MARAAAAPRRGASLCAGALVAALACLLPGTVSRGAEATYRDTITTARQSMAKGDLRHAEAEMRTAVKVFPNNPEVHALLAQIYLKEGNSPAAEEEARLARWHEGNDDEIAPVLAEALVEQDKMSQAIHDVAPAERAMKAEAAVRRSLALAHMALGESATGEALLADSRRLDPDSEQNHIGAARLDLVQGKLTEAEAELTAARAQSGDAVDVLRLEGDLRRARGDLEGALAEYTKAVEQRPDDLTLRAGRAMILIKLDRPEEAQKDVDAALDEAPFSLTPNFLAGLLAARRGDLKAADDTLTGVSGSFDSIPDGYYVLGAVKFREKQYDSAIFNLAKYIGLRPDELQPRLLLASAALGKGDPLRAIQVLSPEVYRDNPDPRAVALLEQAYIAAGRKLDAIELFQREADRHSDDPRFGVEAAAALLGFGDDAGGSLALEKLAATDRGLAEAGPPYILNELRLGRLANASAAAERLAARDSTQASQLLLGIVRLADLRYTEAERLFRGILDRDPENRAAKINLAQLYGSSGRPAEARQVYESLLQKNPNDEQVLRALAELAAQQDDLAAAASWLTKAAAAAPSDAAPLERLVDIEMRAKDWPAAMRAAQELAQRFPGPGTTEILAASLAQSGDVKGAIATLADFRAHNGGTLGLYHMLAAYEHADGNFDAAREAYHRALAIDPLDEAAMTGLVDLDFEQEGADKAVATARIFVVRAPEFTDLLAANVLARAGRLDEAVARLREGAIYRPSIRNSGRMAELVFAEGQHEHAELMLRDLLTKTDAVPVRLSLANMDMIDGHDSEAVQLYQQVLAAVPNEPIALNNLATLYEAKHDPRARELAIDAYRLAPSAQTADTLGWALALGGEPANALPYLEVAAKDQPQALEVQYHLAVALEASGARDRARSLLERIVAAKASFTGKEDAQRRLEALQHG